MDTILIATFKNEAFALDGMHKLDDLALDGDVDLYERAVIRRKFNGKLEVRKGDTSADWRTLAGAGFGSLAGLLGGPVGFVVGMLAGAVIGSAFGNSDQYAFGQQVVGVAGTEIPPGSVSIVAHVGEKSTSFVEDALRSLGATVHTAKINAEKMSIRPALPESTEINT